MDDIIQFLGSSTTNFDQNIRTITHGFESKVDVGDICQVLKPKNERNWLLLKVLSKKGTAPDETHWCPSWVVSKGIGFFLFLKKVLVVLLHNV